MLYKALNVALFNQKWYGVTLQKVIIFKKKSRPRFPKLLYPWKNFSHGCQRHANFRVVPIISFF